MASAGVAQELAPAPTCLQVAEDSRMANPDEKSVVTPNGPIRSASTYQEYFIQVRTTTWGVAVHFLFPLTPPVSSEMLSLTKICYAVIYITALFPAMIPYIQLRRIPGVASSVMRMGTCGPGLFVRFLFRSASSYVTRSAVNTFLKLLPWFLQTLAWICVSPSRAVRIRTCFSSRLWPPIHSSSTGVWSMSNSEG